MTRPKLLILLIGTLAGVGGYALGVQGLLSGFRISAPVDHQPPPEPPAPTGAVAEIPGRVILFIADGLGFDHLSLSHHTTGSGSVWDRFDVRGWHDPRPAAGSITDSAAAATALASGVATRYGYIGLDVEGTPLPTVLDAAWMRGLATGIVTDSYIWDATPAAFVTHTKNRDDARAILEQLAESKLDLLFGELEDVGEGDVPGRASTLEILARRFHMLDADLKVPATFNDPVAAVFPEDSINELGDTPNLTYLVEVALARMEAAGRPFLLLVESEEMDAASHDQDNDRALAGLRSIESALATVLDYADRTPDTLVVFTADHETGGLAVAYDIDRYPSLRLIWSTTDHTAGLVPLLARGSSSGRFGAATRVWQIGIQLRSIVDSMQTGSASADSLLSIP